MRVHVLGAGRMGRAAAWDLARQPDVESVILADADPDALSGGIRVADSPKCTGVLMDILDDPAVLRALDGTDAALAAVSYGENLRLSRLAIEAGTHLVDMGGNNDVVGQQLRLDAAAREKGVTILPDTGLAPGMAGLLAAHAVGRFDEADSVRIRVGGLPTDPEPPLNYALVFSVSGLINEYAELCVALRDGRVVTGIEPLTEVEEIEFPPPFGLLEAFHTSGGASTLPSSLEGRVRSLDYKTIRYPGHAAVMKSLLDLGLMDGGAIRVGGVSVAPRAVLEACLAANLPEGRDDCILLRVTARGTRDGREREVVYEMIDRADTETGLTAMMRCTAFPASILTLMCGRGQLPPGAATQESVVDTDRFIQAVQARGLPLTIRIADC